jgi:hypothetical protein
MVNVNLFEKGHHKTIENYWVTIIIKNLIEKFKSFRKKELPVAGLSVLGFSRASSTSCGY